MQSYHIISYRPTSHWPDMESWQSLVYRGGFETRLSIRMQRFKSFTLLQLPGRGKTIRTTYLYQAYGGRVVAAVNVGMWRSRVSASAITKVAGSNPAIPTTSLVTLLHSKPGIFYLYGAAGRSNFLSEVTKCQTLF